MPTAIPPAHLREPPPSMLPPPERRLRERMLRLAVLFCEHSDYTLSSLSNYLLANGSRLQRLLEDPDQDVRTRTAERCIAWLEYNWPAGAPWPMRGKPRRHS